mgnify:CR=1 FL=1
MQRLSRLNRRFPIVGNDGAPEIAFQQQWQRLVEAVEGLGVRSNGQVVISASRALGAADKGANILLDTAGITLTFPASGYDAGDGVAVSNVSGGNVTLAFPGGSDIGTTLPNNGTFFAFCDGNGFWRQYGYSAVKL